MGGVSRLPYLYCIRKPCKAQREKTGGFALFEPGKRNLITFASPCKAGRAQACQCAPGRQNACFRLRREKRAQGAMRGACLPCNVSYVIMKKDRSRLLFSHLGGRRGRHMFCTYCGAHLTGGERFCPGCGAALLPAEAAGPSVQRPSAAPQGTAEQGWQQPAYTGYMPSWPAQSCKNALAGCILCAGVWEGGRHGEG